MIEFLFGLFILAVLIMGAYEYGKSDGNRYGGRK